MSSSILIVNTKTYEVRWKKMKVLRYSKKQSRGLAAHIYEKLLQRGKPKHVHVCKARSAIIHNAFQSNKRYLYIEARFMCSSS